MRFALFLSLFYFAFGLSENALQEYEKVFERVVKQKELANDKSEASAAFFPKEDEHKLGKVDLGILFLFHPRMQEYNFEVDSFVKPVRATSADPRFAMKERQENYKKIRKEVQQKSRQTMDEIKTLEQSLFALKASFVQDVNRVYFENKNQAGVAQKKVQEIERHYFDSRLSVEKEIAGLRKEYLEWRDKNVAGVFLEREERNQILDQITTEIQSLLEQERQKKDLTFLVHSPLLRGEFRGLNLDLSFYNFTSAANFRNQYYSLLQNQIFLGEGDRRASVEAEYEAISSYLSHYKTIKNLFEPLVEETPVVARYEQLTFEILKTLWSKYQISSVKQSRLLEVIHQWMKAGGRV